MSTQTIDAIEFAKRIHALIKDCLRRDNIPKGERDAMLFAYSEVLDTIKEMCKL